MLIRRRVSKLDGTTPNKQKLARRKRWRLGRNVSLRSCELARVP